jgi:IPTL-CTERM motif
MRSQSKRSTRAAQRWRGRAREMCLWLALCVAWTSAAHAQTAVPLQNAAADFSQSSFDASQAIDGDTTNGGWAIHPSAGVQHVLTVQTQSDTTVPGYVTFRMPMNFGDHVLRRFRFSYTMDARGSFGPASGNWVVLDSAQGTLTDVASGSDWTGAPQGDGSWFTTGSTQVPEYRVSYPLNASGVTGFRLEGIPDARLPSNGPGSYFSNGNFVLTELLAFTENVSIGVSPSSASLETTSINGSSTSQVFTLTNTTGGVLVLSSYTLIGADAGQFSLDAGTCGTQSGVVPPGQSCQITVTFAPTRWGNASASAAAPVAVPTLSEWGAMLMFVLLAGSTLVAQRRRQA